MMQKYSEAMSAKLAEGREDWAQIQRWIERFICGTSAKQGIVGKRHHPDGGIVTQEQFDRGDKAAHVCPFVRDSIDTGMFYIEESDHTNPLEIRKLLLARVADFKNAEPPFDPIAAGKAATMPIGLKTLVIFFPKYEPKNVGPDTAIDRIFQWMIIPFIRQGLMLGQFYRGCAEPAAHAPEWKKVLTAPFLAFAFRYMQPHDRLFVKPGTPGYPIYQKFFANELAEHH